MTRATDRRRNTRLLVVLVSVSALSLAVLRPAALGASPEPTRASGHVEWLEAYWEHDDEIHPGSPNDTASMSQGVITVRLRRQGDAWVDDGSTFRSTAQEAEGPYPLSDVYDCTLFGYRLLSLAEGRLDSDPANWIRLDLDPAAGTASFGAAVGGRVGQTGISWGLLGRECQGPDTHKELRSGGGGGSPGCPNDGGVIGTMDAPGSASPSRASTTNTGRPGTKDTGRPTTTVRRTTGGSRA